MILPPIWSTSSLTSTPVWASSSKATGCWPLLTATYRECWPSSSTLLTLHWWFSNRGNVPPRVHVAKEDILGCHNRVRAAGRAVLMASAWWTPGQGCCLISYTAHSSPPQHSHPALHANRAAGGPPQSPISLSKVFLLAIWVLSVKEPADNWWCTQILLNWEELIKKELMTKVWSSYRENIDNSSIPLGFSIRKMHLLLPDLKGQGENDFKRGEEKSQWERKRQHCVQRQPDSGPNLWSGDGRQPQPCSNPTGHGRWQDKLANLSLLLHVPFWWFLLAKYQSNAKGQESTWT